MINILMNWAKAFFDSKRRLLSFIVISVIVGVVIFLLALKLSPWLYAMNVRVKLHLSAPSETKLSVCWDRAQTQCLPFVPYRSEDRRIARAGEIADTWLSELPPRPVYLISIIFKSKSPNETFQYLELDSWPGTLWGFIPGAGIQDIKLGINEFIDHNSGQFIANREVKPGPLQSQNDSAALWMVWGLLFSIYLFFAILLCAIPFVLQNIGTIKNVPISKYPWWVYIVLVLGGSCMLLLIMNSPVIFNQYDPKFYLQLATSENWFNPSRPQGYQLFLALVLWLFRYNLNGISIVQAILFFGSVTTCMWTLRKWLHPLVAVVAILLMLFSPGQINWALSVMRESLFVSLVLFGVTAIIAYFTSEDKLKAKFWLFIFALCCLLTAFVRENGILMPVVLIPVLLAEGAKSVKLSGGIWKHIQALFLLLIRYSLPILGTCIVYFGLSTYNYLNYGYFQYTLHATSHHLFWQQITTSNFDSRSLLRRPGLPMSQEAETFIGQNLFSSFIVDREQNPTLDPIINNLFPTLNQAAAARGLPVNWFRSASIIEEIGKRAKNLTPWQANLVGILRQYREFIDAETSGYFPLLDDTKGLAEKQQVLKELKKNIYYQGKPVDPNSLIGIYYNIFQGYSWYRLLFILALLFSLYLLRYDNLIYLTPMMFFIANACLMLMLRIELGRFIECLDVLLILQIALGLSHWIYRNSKMTG